MSDSRDDQSRKHFWHEFVVPTARGLESFGWRVVLGGIFIKYVLCCMGK